MSRYIDPIWLYENVQEQAPQFAETLKDLILVAPSIDIVRCKECKYAHMTYGGECKYCDIWSLEDPLYLDGDFFCADGERSEKPNNSKD